MLTPKEACALLLRARPEQIRRIFADFILVELRADPDWERDMHRMSYFYD